MFSFRDTFESVDVAFTDREGGVSVGSRGSLNLALSDADDPRNREENLRRALAGFAPDLAEPVAVAQAVQVHGTHVLEVEGSLASDQPLPEADALVTSVPDLVLLVRVADCVPVVLADPGAGVVGVAHAGRVGLAGGIVPATVTAMRDLGARRLRAWIGPHVCGACYEVPAAMQEDVARLVPQTRTTSRRGTAALDLGAGARAQLIAAGADVVAASPCTVETVTQHSYRRDGAGAGRTAGLVRRRPA